MKLKLLILCTVLLAEAGLAQFSASLTATGDTVSIPLSAASSTPNLAPSSSAPVPSGEAGRVAILDYKSVYEAETIEEEIKMAAERFGLTADQQDMWLTAATDRRAAEKVAKDKLASSTQNYERDGVYRGLRTSHNTFYETITGFMTPQQKNALETDRVILEEKRKRIAKLPPPPPPAPTVTVAPVDSSAIKEAEKTKDSGKPAKKKKK